MTAALPKHPNLTHYYQRQNRRKIRFIGLGLMAVLASLAFDLAIGPGTFNPGEVLQLFFAPDDLSKVTHTILVNIRLPVAIIAVLVGCMLSVSGAQMQTILNNPLAEPFTLGISSAASFGAAVVIILLSQVGTGLSATLWVTLSAFSFSMLTALFLFFFTRLRDASTESMILVGIALLFLFNALLGLMQFSATDVQLSQIVFWMMGSLSRANWHSVAICAAVLALSLPMFIYRAWALTTMRMGDEKAESLGVDTSRVRIEIFIFVSLLTATAVSFVGTIAFVGLVGPHIARLLVGEDQRYFIPMTMIAGALMMSLASVISKSIIFGVVYPIGIVTSLIGIPFFLFLLFNMKRRHWS